MGVGIVHTFDVDHRARQTLSTNLKRLMECHADLNTFPKIIKKCGISNGTLDRIRRCEVGASIDQLDLLAKAFEMEVWQLLVPNLEPANPPMLASVSEAQKAMLEKIKLAAAELLKQ